MHVDHVDSEAPDEGSESDQRPGESEGERKPTPKGARGGSTRADIQPEHSMPLPAHALGRPMPHAGKQDVNPMSLGAHMLGNPVHDGTNASEIVPRDNEEDVHVLVNATGGCRFKRAGDGPGEHFGMKDVAAIRSQWGKMLMKKLLAQYIMSGPSANLSCRQMSRDATDVRNARRIAVTRRTSTASFYTGSASFVRNTR